MTRAVLLCLMLPVSALAQGSSEAGPGGAPSTPAPNGFDEWVQSVMSEWHVPGLAVGAIKDGEGVLLEGYGFRDVEGQLPVTPRTLMAIGSNSKSWLW